jgi:hypothetical protein
MAFRLAEAEAGKTIAPDVQKLIEAAKTEYRLAWSEGSRTLLAKLRNDRQARKDLVAAFGKLNLEGHLDKWNKQAELLNSGKHNLEKMQDSVLGFSRAAQGYMASVEAVVKDPAVVSGFRDLLSGLRLQLATEVTLYQKWVRV